MPRADELRIYVDGPPGAVGAPGVAGHVFLQLAPAGGSQAGQSNLVYGAYPAGPNLYSGPGEIRNDSGRRWDWRIAYPITTDQYNAVARAINPDVSTGFPYHLHRANAGDWVAEIAAEAGVMLPPFTNRLGIRDPNALRVALGQIGAGNVFAGGIVATNTAGRSADGGLVDSPPRDVSFDGIVAQTRTRPMAQQLAAALGLPYQMRGLSTVFLGVNQALLVNVSGANISNAVIAVNWGDGTSTNQQALPARVYRRTGTFNASVAVVNDVAVQFFEFGVSVQAQGGPAVINVNVPAQAPAVGENPGFEYPWWAAVQSGADAPLSLIHPPFPAGANEGGRVSLRVGVAGPDAAYQWFRDGVPLARESTSLLNLDPVRPADAGRYSVRVTNAFPSVVESGPVEVTVTPDLTPPRVLGAVALDPTEVVVVFSEPVAAAATNRSNYSFPGGGEVLMASRLDPRRVRLVTTPRPAGADCVEVREIVDRSAAANLMEPNPTTACLVPATPPVVVVPPVPQTAPAGGAAVFSVVADSLLPLTYQWQRDGVNLPEARQSTLELFNVTAADAANYSVVVGNRAGPVPGAQAALTVLNGTPGFLMASGAAVHAGETLVLPVYAEDPDRPVQALQFALLDGPPGATMDAAGGRLTWPVPRTQPPGSVDFRVRVTDDGQPAASAGTNFSVTIAPPLSVQIRHSAAMVTLVVNSLPERTYQAWQTADLAQPWQPLGDPRTATGTSLEVVDPAPPAAGARFYRVTALPVCVVEGPLARTVVYSRGHTDAVELEAQRASSSDGRAMYETARLTFDVELRPACSCGLAGGDPGVMPLRLHLTISEASESLETALGSFCLMDGEMVDPGSVELPGSSPGPVLSTVTGPLTYRQANRFQADRGTGSWTAAAGAEVPCTPGTHVRRFVLSSLLAGETEIPGWHGPHPGLTAYTDVRVDVEALPDGGRRVDLKLWYLDYVPGYPWGTQGDAFAEASTELPLLDYMVPGFDPATSPDGGITRNVAKVIAVNGRLVDRAFAPKLVPDTSPRR